MATAMNCMTLQILANQQTGFKYTVVATIIKINPMCLIKDRKIPYSGQKQHFIGQNLKGTVFSTIFETFLHTVHTVH